jgi:hypothetical protein
MQREEILAEMRRTATENGGTPLGMRRFEAVTGIGQSDWLRFWSRFSDIQRDAGFEPNQLNAAYDEVVLFGKLIDLTREHRKFPTERERRTKAYNDSSFPSSRVFDRLGNRAQLIAKLIAYCADSPEYDDVVKILEPLAEAGSSDVANDTTAKDEKPGYGFVYLVKGHPGEYKIGRTRLVDRRMSELGATASIEHQLIHEIKTDDTNGIEAYWHKRFQAKRMRGEWFRLTPADVRAFQRWRRIY